MPIILDGTAGIDNNATDLSYTGTLTGGTGVVNLGSGQLVKLANGNVGIGTSSPTFKVEAIGSSPAYFGADSTSGTQVGYRTSMPSNSTNCFVGWVSEAVAGLNGDLALCPRTSASGKILFFTGSTTPSERMRIDSSGNLLVGTTSTPSAGGIGVLITGTVGQNYWQSRANTTNNYGHLIFYNPNGFVGEIATSGSSTSYITSSDYRLKENIAPMTGALAKVAALKPVTYTWKSTGEADEGFIAHELQEVCPSAVTGEKDAVETYTDEDGVEQTRIKPQGIDTSFLVATLTAALQELKAINDAQAQTIESLTARVVALEQA